MTGRQAGDREVRVGVRGGRRRSVYRGDGEPAGAGRRPDRAGPAASDGSPGGCRVSWAAVGVGWVAAAGYGLAPPGLGMDLLYLVVAWGAVAAVVAGVRWHRPRHGRFWWLLGAGLAASGVGELVALVDGQPVAGDAFPGPGAWWQLAAYVLLIAALLDVGRDRARRGVDLPGALDAGILVVGLGVLMWAFLVRPAVTSGTLSLSGRLAAAGFSVGGVLLLALLLRLLTTPGVRGTAYWLLVAASVLGLGSALAHQVFALLPGLSAPATGRGLLAVHVGLLAGFSLVAAAALHPSMSRLGTHDAPTGGRAQTTLGRLGLLAAAALVTPATMAVQLAGGLPVGSWSLVVGGAAMSLLVLARMAVLLAQVRAQAEDLAALADTDPLTGVGNRRAWARQVSRELARAARQDAPLSVAVLDLDHFKAYNDAYGHPGGDEALRLAVGAWAARLRAGDLLARVGGEEFGVLLPGCALPAALAVGDDLRRAAPPGLSVSVGVACWDGAEDDAELLARADAALYAAKHGGRNRVAAAVRYTSPTGGGYPPLQVVRRDAPGPHPKHHSSAPPPEHPPTDTSSS